MSLRKLILILVLAFHITYAQKQPNTTISRDLNTNSEIYDDNILRVWRLALPIGYNYFSRYMNSDVNKVKQFWKDTEKQLNKLYMREVGIKFQIIDDEKLIQKDKTIRDNIFGGWGINYSMKKSTEEINKMIDPQSYDIGLFLEELDKTPKKSAGLAWSIGSAYYNKHKGDSFSVTQNIETIAHELGHLLGSAHTASQDALNSLKIEPKLGQSLMGYGASPKMFFSLMNIKDMRKKILYPYYKDTKRKHLTNNNVASLGERNNFPLGIVTKNSAPQLNKKKLKKVYNIPSNTFFQFKLEASDEDNTELLYTTHQINEGKAKFNARPFSENNTITFQESYNSSGYIETPFDTNPDDTYNFLLAVNDGKNAYKNNYAVRYDSYKTQVNILNGTPFTANPLKPYYSKQGHINLKWNVDKKIFANTKVRILLSDDFGKTFNYVLKEATENDGQCEVILPNIKIGKIPYKNNIQKVRAGVIKIEVIDHIAYALTALKPTNSRNQFTGGFEVVQPEFGITFKNTPNPNIEIHQGDAIPDIPKGITAVTKCSDGSANVKYSEERIDINDDKIKYIINRIWTATNKCAEKVSFIQKIKVKSIQKSIEKLPLKITLKNINKVYDGNNTANLTANDFTLSGVQNNDAITLDLTNINATYDNKNVGTNKTITINGLTLKGTDTNKYQLSNNQFTFPVGTITPKTITVTLKGKVSKTYNGNNTATLLKENYSFNTKQEDSSNQRKNEGEEKETTFNKEQWHQDLMKYIKENDRSKIKPYRNFYVNTDKITLGDGETIDINLLDDNGNKVNKDLKWYVLVTAPFDKLFSAEESRINTPPQIINGTPYQMASHLIINENQNTVTARRRVKKEVAVYAWLVAVYKNKYAHLIEVDIKPEEHQKREKQVETKIQEILEKMKNLSDKDKVVYAFNYLVDNVTYDNLYYGDAAYYNTFIKKGAVCEGYATGFQLLMERSGIISEYQEGFVKKGVQGETTASRHAWNRVLIDGQWYYVDATWGDPKGRAKDYRYLFASREFFNQSRQMTDDGEDLGTKLLGYGSGHTISIDNNYNGESVDEQISKKVKKLIKGENKITINIPWDKTDLQYKIGNKLNQYDGVKFIKYIPLQSSAELKATIFEYTIEYTGNSNVNTEELTVSYSELESNDLKIAITLDKPLKLIPSNFYSQEANIITTSFKNENNTKYEFSFEASNHKNVTFTIKKEGCSFNNGTKTYNLPNETFIEKPNVKFFGKGDNYGILTGLIPNKTQYNLGNGLWITAKNESEKVYPTEKLYYHSPTTKAKIFVRNKVLNSHSLTQEIYIGRPFNTPSWVKVVNENGLNIVKYARDTEYKLANADNNTWILTTGETIKGLQKGEYLFRTKGKENNFASSNVKITINTPNTASINGFINTDKVELDNFDTGTYDNKNAGTNKTITVTGLSLKGIDAQNYTLKNTTISAEIGEITQKPITITPDNQSKIYGDTDPTLTYTVTPALLNGDNFIGNLTRNTGENVGNYTITQGNLSAGNNYKINFISDKTLQIKPKTTLNISLTESINKTYDGNTSATVNPNSLILNGKKANDDVYIDFTNATYDNKNVGTNKTITLNGLTLKGADANKYQLATTSLNATVGIITQKTITITPDNQSKIYGDTDPTLTYTVTPALLNGDNFIGNLTRNTGENVGNYAITQGNLSAGNNYKINFISNKTLQITKASITDITLDDKTFDFDGNPKSLKIKGNLPNGVNVTYTNNKRTQIGTHTVTAHLSGKNYNDLNLTATLTINRDVLIFGEINKALTPNNDGINDFWYIKMLENYFNNKVEIYNRWGQLVFKIDNYDNNHRVFNGFGNTYTNNELPQGTYFYKIILNENTIKQGSIELRR